MDDFADFLVGLTATGGIVVFATAVLWLLAVVAYFRMASDVHAMRAELKALRQVAQAHYQLKVDASQVTPAVTPSRPVVPGPQPYGTTPPGPPSL